MMLSNINTFRFGGNRYNEALWGRTAGRHRQKKGKEKEVTAARYVGTA